MSFCIRREPFSVDGDRLSGVQAAERSGHVYPAPRQCGAQNELLACEIRVALWNRSYVKIYMYIN